MVVEPSIDLLMAMGSGLLDGRSLPHHSAHDQESVASKAVKEHLSDVDDESLVRFLVEAPCSSGPWPGCAPGMVFR
jgi:hypothetical protein